MHRKQKVLLKRVLYSVIMIVSFTIVAFCILAHPKILRTDEIEDYVFGSRLFTADNIPYSYDGITVYGGWSVVLLHHYPLPKVQIDGMDVADLFIQLASLPYENDQMNPNLIFSHGGNCQAFSIYLRTALNKMGIQNGYFVMPGHISVWAVIDNTLYGMDVTTKRFSRLSFRDRELVEKYVDLTGVE